MSLQTKLNLESSPNSITLAALVGGVDTVIMDSNNNAFSTREIIVWGSGTLSYHTTKGTQDTITIPTGGPFTLRVQIDKILQATNCFPITCFE